MLNVLRIGSGIAACVLILLLSAATPLSAGAEVAPAASLSDPIAGSAPQAPAYLGVDQYPFCPDPYVVLSWSSAAGATYYELERSLNGSSGYTLMYSGYQRTYTATSTLQNGWYRVRACNTSGCSSYTSAWDWVIVSCNYY